MYGNYYDIEVYGMSDVMSYPHASKVSENTSITGVPQVVGLDFNVNDLSTMQSGVLGRESSIKWYNQPANYPHTTISWQRR